LAGVGCFGGVLSFFEVTWRDLGSSEEVMALKGRWITQKKKIPTQTLGKVVRKPFVR